MTNIGSILLIKSDEELIVKVFFRISAFSQGGTDKERDLTFSTKLNISSWVQAGELQTMDRSGGLLPNLTKEITIPVTIQRHKNANNLR